LCLLERIASRAGLNLLWLASLPIFHGPQLTRHKIRSEKNYPRRQRNESGNADDQEAKEELAHHTLVDANGT
jgi:hypothetical protein